MYQIGRDLCEHLEKECPNQCISAISLFYSSFGTFYLDVDRVEDAERIYQKSINLLERLSASCLPSLEDNLVSAYNDLLYLYEDTNQMDKARSIKKRMSYWEK